MRASDPHAAWDRHRREATLKILQPPPVLLARIRSSSRQKWFVGWGRRLGGINVPLAETVLAAIAEPDAHCGGSYVHRARDAEAPKLPGSAAGSGAAAAAVHGDSGNHRRHAGDAWAHDAAFCVS